MPHVTRSDQDKLINSILDHVNTGQDIELPKGIYESTAKNGWMDNWMICIDGFIFNYKARCIRVYRVLVSITRCFLEV